MMMEMDLSPYHVVATVGGDGTFHEAVNGLLMRVNSGRCTLAALPVLAPIPCGSGNTFAFDLGVSTYEQGLENILRVRTVCVIALCPYLGTAA